MDGTVLIVKITSVVSLRLETRKLMMCRIDLTISSPANGLKCRKNLPLCSTSQFALLFFLWGLCDRQWLIGFKNSETSLETYLSALGSWIRVAGILCSMSSRSSGAGEVRDAGDAEPDASPSPPSCLSPLSPRSFTPLSGLLASSVDKREDTIRIKKDKVSLT